MYDIKVLHVARRFISDDLSELRIGYDLEHFKALAKFMKKNSVLFQSKSKKFHNFQIENLSIFLASGLWTFFISIVREASKNDLLVAQNPFFGSFLVVIGAKLVRKPVLISIHGYEFTVRQRQFIFRKFVCKNADFIRVNSDIVRKTVISWGIDPKKITIIEDRVDCDHFNPEIDGTEIRNTLGKYRKIAISVGSLIEIKGFDTLLEAVKIVKKSENNFLVMILGDGEQKEFLQKKAKELGILDSVVFMGNIPYENIPKYYAASDLFVHPSYVESMGRVILEAQASGKPVVATNIGGIPEAASKSAILVPSKDPKLLADGILKVLKSQDLAKSMSYEGRKFVLDNFEFWKQEKKLVEFYEKCINRKNKCKVSTV